MQETQEMWVQSLGGKDPLEKEKATSSSILAGKFHGQRSPVGYSHGVTKNRTQLSTWHMHKSGNCSSEKGVKYTNRITQLIRDSIKFQTKVCPQNLCSFHPVASQYMCKLMNK